MTTGGSTHVFPLATTPVIITKDDNLDNTPIQRNDSHTHTVTYTGAQKNGPITTVLINSEFYHNKLA